jgi:oxygen-independent coproporphyrinogen-3 oxidase
MRDRDVGVYLHVPFCERVCPYCDFAVVAARSLARDREDRYVDALLAELARRRDDFGDRRLASLYLGGGTPSLLRPDSVERLREAVFRAFAPGDDVEVTLELNPSTVERERLPGFRAAGVNRLSVGVQSFDDPTLKRLGRAHRAGEAHRTLEACRAAGFAELSLDLIFAAPGQTLAALERDLTAVLDFAPEHVSAYELTLEPGTPFAAAAARGRLARPDEDALLAMMELVERRLTAAGYERYELSSYARSGHRARHNRRYWERRPVLGLGLGAFSTDPPGPGRPHGSRRSNPRELPRYLAAVAAGAPPHVEVLGPDVARGEAVFLALRTARGLDAAAFADEFGESPRGFFADPIGELVAAGLLDEDPSGDLRLTGPGRRLSDRVFEHFV